jgi:hypothetical protein
MGHLAVDPGAPILVRAAADALLWGHIGGGTVGIASGFVAAFAKKGGRWHRWAGNTFFVSMLFMAGIGAAVSPFLNDMMSAIAGMLTLYLILTGWSAARRRTGGTGTLEYAGLAVVLAIGAADVVLWQIAMRDPHAFKDIPPPAFAVIGLIVAAAAIADMSVIWRGGVTGAARTARHLWRMLTALTIASGSAFLGQVKVQAVIPHALHGMWLFVPVLVPLALMIYYLARTWMTGRRARARAAARGMQVAHA